MIGRAAIIHELLHALDQAPMRAIGFGELSEEEFLQAAQRVHLILRARNAKLDMVLAGNRARSLARAAAEASA